MTGQTHPKKVVSLTDTIASKDYKNEQVDAYVNAGYSLFRLNGKRPHKDCQKWQATPYDPTVDGTDFPANYGVVLKADDIVLDVDPRNFARCENGVLVSDGEGKPLTGPSSKLTPADIGLEEGAKDNPLTRLLKAVGLPGKPETHTVKTGGGGYHIHFKKPAGYPHQMLVKNYPGIEFKSQGHFLVGPGSVHPNSRETYKVQRQGLASIPNAPEALLEICKRGETLTGKGLEEARDDEGAQHRYVNYLKNAPVAIENCYGDLATYKTAAMGRDFGLSQLVVFELMASYYNPRCMPSWSHDDLQKKVKNAFSYGKREQGGLHPELDFAEVVFEKRDKAADLEEKYVRWALIGGKPKSNDLGNTANYFLTQSFETFVNPLYRLLRYNEFSDQIEFNFPAPWHRPGSFCSTWTDTDAIQLKYWLSQEKHYLTNVNICHEAAVTLSSTFYGYHPVKDYLNKLEWDGVKRLDNLLIRYAEAKDSPYVRAVGKNTMIAAVARIFEPGCQFDHILILEGDQGTGKSSFVRVLGGAWYKDIVIDPHNKDTVDAMKGGWLIEASEMEFARRTDVQALKAFITRVSDFVRPAYARTTRAFPRQSITIGTTNPDANGTYLRDNTGNRRFWPVATGRIDLKALREDRDQLWAEALHRYHQGETYYLDTKELVDEAKKEQAERTVQDSWAEVIELWMAKQDSEGLLPEVVTAAWVGFEALNLTAKNMDRTAQARIADSLVSLGWERGKFFVPDIHKTASSFKRTIDPLSGL